MDARWSQLSAYQVNGMIRRCTPISGRLDDCFLPIYRLTKNSVAVKKRFSRRSRQLHPSARKAEDPKSCSHVTLHLEASGTRLLNSRQRGVPLLLSVFNLEFSALSDTNTGNLAFCSYIILACIDTSKLVKSDPSIPTYEAYASYVVSLPLKSRALLGRWKSVASGDTTKNSQMVAH